MTTPAPTPGAGYYDNSDVIDYLHGFYHHGGHDEFAPYNKDYITALVGLGAFVVGFGGLMVVFYFIFLCCRAGCSCCRKEAGCGPNLSRFILLVLVLMMMVMTMCSYVGYGNFIEGMLGVADDCTSLKKSISLLDDGAGELYTQGVQFVGKAKTVGCDDSLENLKYTMNSAIYMNHAEVYATALPDPSKLSTIIDLFENELPNYVSYLLGFAAGLAALVWLVCTMGIMCKSSTLLNLSSLVSVALLLLFIVLIGIEMVLSVMFADFCHLGPNEAVQDLSDRMFPAEAANVIGHYMTCTGTNPLDIHLNKTISSLAVIKNTTSFLLAANETINPSSVTGCDAASLSTFNTWGAAATVTNTAMEAEQKCAPLNDVYFDLVDSALCDKAVSGLFELWATHFAAGALLYVVMFFTSHVKQKCKVLVLMDEEGAVKAIPLGPPLAPHTV